MFSLISHADPSAGVRFIPYLNRGNYLGIEKEGRLVKMGIAKELGQALYAGKAPEFVISSGFEFEKFSRKPDFALAQSLFTHLRLNDIELCLGNLRRFVNRERDFTQLILLVKGCEVLVNQTPVICSCTRATRRKNSGASSDGE